MNYKVVAPKYCIGDTVNYTHHNGSVHTGKIAYCETHYNNDNYYHIYCVYKSGAKRASWVGEAKILEVVSHCR
jgi:hypothetical protein